MDEIQKMIEDSIKAEEVYQKLKSTESISDVADTIDSLDENMAKLVLKNLSIPGVNNCTFQRFCAINNT
mgnify:CR=1 FL=1